MWKRLTFGPLMIAALIGLVWLDSFLGNKTLSSPVLGVDKVPPGSIVFLICLALGALGSKELASIIVAKGAKASAALLTLASWAGLCVSFFAPNAQHSIDSVAIVGSAAVLLFFTSLLVYSKGQNTKGVVLAAGASLLAFVYLGIMLGFVLAIRREHSVWILLWLLLVVKACDTGAYFTGRAIGKHKLILWLSPGKTWEGLVGGIALSCAASVGGARLLTMWAGETMPGALPLIVAGVVFAVVGQAGDLVMSLFKRDAGLKDSGSSIPGFGGVLDVLDSPLLVTPLAFWWLKWALPGA
ncbi:phosphatidate cytidylyltransferase [Limnofasciculus baicalensis]|uniref:Phosphatidate cytidylyltransferase n=1 Tax=Limnofasciculus baicalensis BBK-W-15 TaxID=2699891 RepID=A0AAE3KQ64_9CYAN|nr:phosphatidate cytidylyltransferase [Limnofasciculus baicalensis]MCP2732210.1 phosphatidate cytidylyltransferase [Limnofasciculus baicalensis BBK-W-15]